MTLSIKDIVSLSVWLCYIIPTILLLYTRNIVYLIILSGLLFSQIVNHLLKSILGIRYYFCRRPSGAVNCDLLNGGGDARLVPGFPSGHVSLVACFVTMMYLFFGVSPVLGLLWIFLMMWSRVARNCHTLLQTFAGAISGFLVGWLWYYLFTKLK